MQELLKRVHGTSEAERLLHRLHCVVLVLNGFSASEAARLFGDSPRAVAYWVTRFGKLGVEGLQAEPKPGRPSSFTPQQLKKLKQFVKQQLSQSKPMNAKLLSQYIKRTYEIDLTPRHCWRILKRLKA